MGQMTEQAVIKVVQSALRIDQPLTMSSSADTIPEWDSLGQINIIVALDEALGGGVSEMQEMALASSVGKIIELLRGSGKIADA